MKTPYGYRPLGPNERINDGDVFTGDDQLRFYRKITPTPGYRILAPDEETLPGDQELRFDYRGLHTLYIRREFPLANAFMAVQRKIETSMSDDDLRNLAPGDIIQHLHTKECYMVDNNFGKRVTAVKTVDVTNPTEWKIVSKVNRTNP